MALLAHSKPEAEKAFQINQRACGEYLDIRCRAAQGKPGKHGRGGEEKAIETKIVAKRNRNVEGAETVQLKRLRQMESRCADLIKKIRKCPTCADEDNPETGPMYKDDPGYRERILTNEVKHLWIVMQY